MPSDEDHRSGRRDRWKDGPIADITANLDVFWDTMDGLLDIQYKITQAIFETPGHYHMIIRERRAIEVMTNVSLHIHLSDPGTATRLHNHRRRLDDIAVALDGEYGAVALSARSQTGDDALARRVEGVLGIYHTEIRCAYLDTNRAKLLADECSSLTNRCKELARLYSGVTFLGQVDVRFTAYSQVAGPIIIRQINTANNLANFLPEIVSLLTHDMQYRAMTYWSNAFTTFTDPNSEVPHELRERLKASLGSGTSHKARLHFDVLSLGQVPQTTMERMREMGGILETRRLARPDDLNVLGGSGILFALWSDFVTFMTSVNLSPADAMVAPGYLFSMLPVDDTPDQSETDMPDTSEEAVAAALNAALERYLEESAKKLSGINATSV